MYSIRNSAAAENMGPCQKPSCPGEKLFTCLPACSIFGKIIKPLRQALSTELMGRRVCGCLPQPFPARPPAAALHPPLPVAPTPSAGIQLGLVKLVLVRSPRSDSSSSLLISEIRQRRLAGHGDATCTPRQAEGQCDQPLQPSQLCHCMSPCPIFEEELCNSSAQLKKHTIKSKRFLATSFQSTKRGCPLPVMGGWHPQCAGDNGRGGRKLLHNSPAKPTLCFQAA